MSSNFFNSPHAIILVITHLIMELGIGLYELIPTLGCKELSSGPTNSSR